LAADACIPPGVCSLITYDVAAGEKVAGNIQDVIFNALLRCFPALLACEKWSDSMWDRD
jgi:hypothetical protein